MGWNRPKNGEANSCSFQKRSGDRYGFAYCWRNRPVRGAIAGAVVVLGAAVAAWWLWPEGRTRQDAASTKKGLIKEVKPAAVTAQEAEKKPKDPHEGYVLSSAGVWQPANRPYRANAKKVHNVFTNYSNVARKDEQVAYRSATEQLLLQTFSCRLGQEPMPFLKLPRKEMDNLVGILISSNPVTEKDSPELAAHKEILAAAKKELLAYLKEGGRPNDFFEHYHRQLELAAQKRRDALTQLNRIIREDHDPELARQFRDKVNEQFEKEGILKISKKIYDEPEDN